MYTEKGMSWEWNSVSRARGNVCKSSHQGETPLFCLSWINWCCVCNSMYSRGSLECLLSMFSNEFGTCSMFSFFTVETPWLRKVWCILGPQGENPITQRSYAKKLSGSIEWTWNNINIALGPYQVRYKSRITLDGGNQRGRSANSNIATQPDHQTQYRGDWIACQVHKVITLKV